MELNKTLKVNDATDASGIDVGSFILSGGGVVTNKLNIGGNVTTNGNLFVNKNGYFGMDSLKSIIPLPVPFTSIFSSYGGGSYYISSSNSISSKYYEVFNSVQSNEGKWLGQGYSNDNGTYTGNISTSVDGIIVKAEYLQIRLPSEVVLTSYTLLSKSQPPDSWEVCGSNNGSEFYLLDKKLNYTGSLQQNVMFSRNLSE